MSLAETSSDSATASKRDANSKRELQPSRVKGRPRAADTKFQLNDPKWPHMWYLVSMNANSYFSSSSSYPLLLLSLFAVINPTGIIWIPLFPQSDWDQTSATLRAMWIRGLNKLLVYLSPLHTFLLLSA